MGPIVSIRIQSLVSRVHIVTLVVFTTIVSGLAHEYQHAFLPRFEVAAGSALAILVTIVAHDYLRASAFRSAGVRVRGLDFFLGGASPRLDDASNSPRTEIVAGLSGLLVVTVVALASVFFRHLLSVQSDLYALATVTTYALIGVAVLQALPALPLDGGRMLRGLVWHLYDDPVRGSRGSAVYGHIVTAGMIGAGFILLVQPGAWPYWGLGLIVAGLQIVVCTAGSVRDSFTQQRGSDLRLEAMVIPWSRRIQSTASLDSAVDALIAEGDGPPLLVVSDSGDPVGMLMMRNLKGTRRSQWASQRIESVMTPLVGLAELQPDMNAREALLRLDDSSEGWAVYLDERGTVRLINRDRLESQLFEMAESQAVD